MSWLTSITLKLGLKPQVKNKYNEGDCVSSTLSSYIYTITEVDKDAKTYIIEKTGDIYFLSWSYVENTNNFVSAIPVRRPEFKCINNENLWENFSNTPPVKNVEAATLKDYIAMVVVIVLAAAFSAVVVNLLMYLSPK